MIAAINRALKRALFCCTGLSCSASHSVQVIVNKGRLMTKLSSILNVSELADAIEQGYVAVKAHNSTDLYICDYTPRAQYAGAWSSAVKACRGLVVAGHPLSNDATVIARPFAKFANFGEHGVESKFGELPLEQDFEIFEKLDGSLAIAFNTAVGVMITTRGSFQSEQAIAAREIWNQRYSKVVIPDGVTLLFEFIAPWNRIVVSYEDITELILLTAIDNATGADVDVSEVWPGQTVKRYEGFKDFDAVVEHIGASQETNQEGFVVRFVPATANTPAVRCKLKLAEYVRLHRIATGISTTSIWEALRAGNSLDELLEATPDEFYKFIKSVQAELTAQFEKIESDAAKLVSDVRNLPRKEAAQVILSTPNINSGVAFCMLSGFSYQDIIWKVIKPKFAKLYSLTNNG